MVKSLISLPYAITIALCFLVIIQIVFDKKAVSIYLDPAKTDDKGKVLGWKRVQIDWFFLRGMASVIGFYFKRLKTCGKFKFDWDVQ